MFIGIVLNLPEMQRCIRLSSPNVELSASEWREAAFIMCKCTKHIQVNYTSEKAVLTSG